MDKAGEIPVCMSRRIPPALFSILIQLVACIPALLWLAYDQSATYATFIQGCSAFLLAWWVELPVWWRLINLGFLPLAWILTQADIEPTWFLAGFALLAATSLGSIRHRVPLYLSSQQAVDTVIKLLPSQPGLRVIDLGCGLGGMLAGLAKQRPDLRLFGAEMAPLNWLVSRLRLRGRAEVHYGSLWDQNLGDFDVIYAYLSPAPMLRLWDKVSREMRPGGILISNTFAIPGIEPNETIELQDFSQARLLIWRK